MKKNKDKKRDEEKQIKRLSKELEDPIFNVEEDEIYEEDY